MNRRFKGLQLGLLMSGLVTAVAVGCGGDDDNDGPGATTGKGGSGGDGSGGKGGKGGSGKGGSGKGGMGNAGDNGVAGDTGVAGEGAGGAPPVTPGEIDDVISAICDWELRCCDDGERVYRLGPDGADAMSCVDFFTFQLHQSNQTNNPFPAGSATGLLGMLGYTVNLDRVVPNALGIGECVALWEAADCNMDAEPPTSCSGTIIPGEGACSLTNLFDPALVEGDECTVELDEGDGNDVECEAGTTCLPAAHADNPESVDICVQRGVAGEPCTEDEDCDWNFYCDPANDCQPKGGVGDDCTFNDPAAPAPNDEDAGCQAGLKCHPADLVCVENCATDYPCVVDIECPDGESCAPLTVGNDTTSWSACRALGTTVVSCDTSADCAESRRCSGGDCLADLVITQACTTDADCEQGSFCDTAPWDTAGIGRIIPMVCTGYFDVTEGCYPGSVTIGFNSGCNPATADQCVFLGTYPAGNWQCSTEKLIAGDNCYPYTLIPNGVLEPTDCAQGLDCEYANQAATTYTCTAGAGLGDQCDADLGTGTYQLCGTGLFCDPITSECLAKQDPGGNCEDANGLSEDGLCKNGDCVAHWSGDGSFICSDAPVPLLEDGDNLTCGP